MQALYALAAALLLLACISARSEICDLEAWNVAINESCASNDESITRKLILNASSCAISEQFHQELRLLTSEPFLNQTLHDVDSSAGFNAPDILILSNSSSATVNALEELNRDILSYYDGFVVEAEALPEFAQAGVVAPLDMAIISVPELNWFRINRFYRGFSAVHLARVYGVPLGGAGVFTYYRQDLFQRFNLTIPSTWEGLLATAQAWSAAPPLPDISPFCMSRRSYCARTLLLSIAAPHMQAAGTRDGFLIDPGNGTLLLNSTGFTAALRIWQQLSTLSMLDANTSCSASSDRFSEGACLMTVQLFEKFKVYASSMSAVSGKLGVALPPGSSHVMDRSTGKMEPCTQTSCPYASSVPQQGPSPNGNGGGGDATALVNWAPFMWGGFVGMVNARNPSSVQDEVIHYFARITASASLDNVLRRGSHIAPFRADHWSAAAKRNWTDAGYPEPAVTQMLEVLRSLHAFPNLAPQLRLPGQGDVSRALVVALANLTAGQSPEKVAAALQAMAEAALLARYGMKNGTYGFLSLYRQQLGYVGSSSSSIEPRAKPSSSSGVSRQTVVVIAVVIGLVLLLAAVVVLEVRNKRRHKDLLGRVKPPLGDPDTTIVVTSIQDFDELWEVLLSDASERALQQFSDLVDCLLRRHSGYRAPSEEEEDVVAAFHCPRDACEFALELQRELLQLKWPKHVLEMEQFRPQYLVQTRRAASFNQSCKGARAPMSPPHSGSMPTEDDDKLFTLDTGTENVRSFGEQCVASWGPADALTPDAELVFCGIRARVGVAAVGFSHIAMHLEHGERRFRFVGEAVRVAAAAAAAAQGGMVLIPQNTFRQLHLEVLAEQCLFCHLGEYQLTAELPPMDLYLALDRQLLGRLALFGPLSCHMQWSQGAFAAPVHNASMVFTHVVGVQALLAWDYDLMQDVIETFTKLAQVELQQAGGYLVEHVEGFMLTAFHSPADAILWGLRMQELMLKEDWPEELLAHELCEEVTVTVPVRGGEVTSATVFRGPRLKTGIDIGQVLARLHTMTGRMTYRGKVMNRAARISAAASSGQVLCSSEAWESCAASASALRLVTATSLGLFQLKGIQERIEVFHCTYQRHVPSSTRRSSTVSVGLVSSSDNRRKSALVLSSMSHASHHTTSYRTSLHNSVALEHVSTSDVTGGRRGSQASSSTALMGRASLGGGQISEMLQMVGGSDPDRVVNGVGASSARYRAAFVPVVVGGGASGTDGAAAAAAPGGHMSQTGSSHRSQCSGASGVNGGVGGVASTAAAGVMVSRAALAAVLQSRTRSASAIQASSSVAPFRSVSARTRRPMGLSGGAAASESQVSLAAVGGAVAVPPPGFAASAASAAATAAAKWSAGMATSPSATPSLAMAAAAAVAAVHERTTNNIGSNSPQGISGNGHLGDGAPMHTNGLSGVSGGGAVSTECHVATTNAAVYAMLPSVVLSGGIWGSSGSTAAAAHAQGLSCAFGPDMQHLNEMRSVGGGHTMVSVVPDGGGGDASPQDHQMMATIATCVGDMLFDGHYSSTGCAAAADSSCTIVQPHDQQQPQLQPLPPLPPFHFERLVALETLDEDAAPSAEGLGAVGAAATAAGGGRSTGHDADGMLDDGSRVETLEVTVSATGIVRGALSGGASSTGFGAALGSSQGASISRCGSVTAGISYLALSPSGGVVSSPGGTIAGGAGCAGGAAGGAGSHPSSCASSGFGVATYTTHSHLAAVRPSSAAVWRASVSMSSSPQGETHGLTGAGTTAGRHSGSANSADLYLPFPLGVASGGGDGGGGAPSGGGSGTVRSSSGCMALATRLCSPALEGSSASGGSVSSTASAVMNRQPETHVRTRSGDLVEGRQSTVAEPTLLPRRHLAVAHNGRLAAVAAAVAAESSAAAVSRQSPRSGVSPTRGSCQSTRAVLPAVAAAAEGTSTPAPEAADVVPSGIGAPVTSAADAASGNSSPVCVRAVTVDIHGSGDASGSLVISASESHSNSSHAARAVAAVTTSSSATPMNIGSSNGARDSCCAAGLSGPGSRLSLVGSGAVRRSGSGSGSGSGTRLRPNNRTGSGVSNDLTSQAVSPSSTWVSGGSTVSATTNNTAATAAALNGTALTSSAVASSVGSEPTGPPQHPLRYPTQQYHHHNHRNQCTAGAGSLIALLEGVGLRGVGAEAVSSDGDALAASLSPRRHASECEGTKVEDPNASEAEGSCLGQSRLRAVGVGSTGPGSRGGVGGDAGSDAAAMAAAFGIAPPLPPSRISYGGAAAASTAAAAAAFGVGPPLGDYVGGIGVASAAGPTREQLELALELLGESRHGAGGGQWH